MVEVDELFFDDRRNTSYLVMEYIDAPSIEDAIEKQGPLSGKKIFLICTELQA